jgi:hypothetical protein
MQGKPLLAVSLSWSLLAACLASPSAAPALAPEPGGPAAGLPPSAPAAPDPGAPGSAAGASASAAVSAAGSASAPPVAAAPPGARRWRYRGFVEANPGSSGVVKTTVDLVLVEVTRREIEPGLVLGELVAEIGGALATRERLQEAGLESAPFSSFPLRWGLLRDARGKAPRVWLLEGEIPASGATLSRAQKETATFDFNRSVGPVEALPRMPADRAVAYTRQVGVWKSRCEGFEHPAPESGDFYFSERCYNDGAGLTLLHFSSVWGTYRFELATLP